MLVLVCRGMLKRVPVSGGEGWWGPGCVRCSCPVAGTVTLPEMSGRSGLQAAIGVEPSAPGDASYENLETEAAFFGRRPRRAARSRKPPGAGCRSSAADRATQSTHHPELEPSSASSDDHNDLDRDNPAPIAIEAGIPSSPAKHAAHDARARRSSTDAAIKHLTTIPINPHRNSLLLVKSAFAYFSGACEKSVASKREARGETVFEVDFGLEEPPAPGHGALLTTWRDRR